MQTSRPLEAHVARALLDGFETHYALMRQTGQAAKGLFEARDWSALRRLQTERIGWYDTRVAECVERLTKEFSPDVFTDARWGDVKLAYITLLLDHRQPELAEVFFNSVTTRVLHRRYFRNRFMFVRPSVSTEYLDLEEPSYRCYYPARTGLRKTLATLVMDFGLNWPFADLERDVNSVVRALRRAMPRPLVVEPNFQLQVLESLLFRGQEAYVVGRAFNGLTMVPFVVPIVHDGAGRLVLDSVLLDPTLLAVLFSSTRAYFLADIDVPSTWVHFLRRMLPSKPPWELYAMLGFGKASKALFYRDFLHHLRHSTDPLTLAPGTAGLVMLVFTLPLVFIGHGAPAKDGADGVVVGFDAQEDTDSLYARSLSQTELLSILGKDAQARTVANIDACFSGRSAAGPLVPGLQPVIALRPLEATGSRVVLTGWGGDQFAGPLPWPPGSPTSGPSGVGSAEGRCAQGRAEEVAVRATGTGGQPAAPHLSVH